MNKYDKPGIIPIKEARKIGEIYGALNIVIFAIEKSAKRFTVTTWGKTKELCAWAAQISNDIHDSVMKGYICNGAFHSENPYETIDVLRAKLKTAVEALKWYANSENYDDQGSPCCLVNLGGEDIFEPELGEIARQALKDIGE